MTNFLERYRTLLPRHLRSYSSNTVNIPIRSLLEVYDKDLIDFDVYLDSVGENLQRPFVWTLDQQRELITSILCDRKIPLIVVCVNYSMDKETDGWEVIDGKQRLMSLLRFFKNEYSFIDLDGNEIWFDELDARTQKLLLLKSVRVSLVYPKNTFGVVADKEKLELFNFINFAGTAQTDEHLTKVKEWYAKTKNHEVK